MCATCQTSFKPHIENHEESYCPFQSTLETLTKHTGSKKNNNHDVIKHNSYQNVQTAFSQLDFETQKNRKYFPAL